MVATTDIPTQWKRLAVTPPSPGGIAAHRELLEEVFRRLPEEEARIAELRAKGTPWSEVATEFGEQSDALRKRLARATNRVLKELGLEGE
ncbi:MAG: hypothetical protein AAF517_10155 [Planctomycetota bacterium]